MTAMSAMSAIAAYLGARPALMRLLLLAIGLLLAGCKGSDGGGGTGY